MGVGGGVQTVVSNCETVSWVRHRGVTSQPYTVYGLA